MTRNPILGFEIDRAALRYVGHDLQRPECILAEPDGTLWSADARGGVVRIGPLPNGLAFARNGDFLISNFGTDGLELMSRDGASHVLVDDIDGLPIGKVNFVLRDSRDRIWITVSTRLKNWMEALRTVAAVAAAAAR